MVSFCDLYHDRVIVKILIHSDSSSCYLITFISEQILLNCHVYSDTRISRASEITFVAKTVLPNIVKLVLIGGNVCLCMQNSNYFVA